MVSQGENGENAVECPNTPCQFCARLCTSDCSKSGLVGGLDRITCANNSHVTTTSSDVIVIPTLTYSVLV